MLSGMLEKRIGHIIKTQTNERNTGRQNEGEKKTC